ncbi:hypothetical protein TASIC1_0004036400 [Trichoderma asperellum]|uniref:Uncharacterized protein n=1 Tax=Trichoderma asperellum TaxID=101201 RepID=A0A6V8QQR9_TRIAP|nr:hypothetical protein TASIC1_0004036400 [Trichoderma asperellum]
MDDDDDLPTIDLNPSGSDTISSESGQDQPPQDGALPNVVSSNGEPALAEATNSQSEEAAVPDNEDDESALPSSFQDLAISYRIWPA